MLVGFGLFCVVGRPRGREELKSRGGAATFPLWPPDSDCKVVRAAKTLSSAASQMSYFSSVALLKLQSRYEQMYTISTLLLNGCVICHVAPFIWTSCELQAAGWKASLFSFFPSANRGNVIHGKSWRGSRRRGGGGGCCFCNGLISSQSQTNYPLLQLWWILLVTVRELLIKTLLSRDELLAYVF